MYIRSGRIKYTYHQFIIYMSNTLWVVGSRDQLYLYLYIDNYNCADFSLAAYV